MENYLTVAKNLYSEAALKPIPGLCCTTTPVWQLPDLKIPKSMLEMNYGCGSTVHPRDLVNNPTVLYVGGGMELFQFAYFSRRPNAIIGVDAVDDMLKACDANLQEAALENAWFKRENVTLIQGDALHLPIKNESVDIAAQNCLFNIFREADLELALREMYHVLKPHGRLLLSDPISDHEIPIQLRNDSQLRALCLTGALPIEKYIRLITDVGFGTIEIRARRPYRILDPEHYPIDSTIYIESIELCAIKDPVADDGPCVFSGKTAIYHGKEEFFNDNKGHVLMHNQPISICDKTAKNLESLKRPDIFISNSTWFYDGGGCC